MADNSVKMTFVGNEADAARAIATLERRFEKLQNAVNQTGKKSKQASDEASGGMLALAEKVGTAGAAFSVLKTVIGGAAEETRELIRSLDEVGRRKSEQELKLAIQGGFTPEAVRKQMPQVEQALDRVPSTDASGAIAIQTQLASSGFKAADVESGEALEAMLKIKAATNQFGKDVGDVGAAGKSIAQFLKAGGNLEPAAKDMERVGAKMTQVFKDSDIQFPDLAQLAPAASSLKNFGMTESEQIAAFSSLVDVMGGEKGAMGLRNFTTRTATAGSTKERTEALAEMDLKPEDVDMAPGGDRFIDTLKRIREKLDKKTPEEQNRILAKLYGQEAQAAASHLTSPETIAQIEARSAAMEKPGEFLRNVKLFQDSQYAEEQRSINAEEFSKRRIVESQHGMTFGRARQELDRDHSLAFELPENQGIFERFGLGLEQRMSKFNLWLKESVGASPEGPDADARREPYTQRIARAMEENNKLLDKNNKLLEKDKPPPPPKTGRNNNSE